MMMMLVMMMMMVMVMVTVLMMFTCGRRFSTDKSSVELKHRSIFCSRWGEEEVGKTLLECNINININFISFLLGGWWGAFAAFFMDLNFLII